MLAAHGVTQKGQHFILIYTYASTHPLQLPDPGGCVLNFYITRNHGLAYPKLVIFSLAT